MKVNNVTTYSEFFEFVVPGVLLNGVGLLGFCGNILSIIVLSRPQMKSSINCILIGNRILHIHTYYVYIYMLYIWTLSCNAFTSFFPAGKQTFRRRPRHAFGRHRRRCLRVKNENKKPCNVQICCH